MSDLYSVQFDVRDRHGEVMSIASNIYVNLSFYESSHIVLIIGLITSCKVDCNVILFTLKGLDCVPDSKPKLGTQSFK